MTKFIAPTDPRWISTLDAITAELVSDSLVYRYNVDASPEGLAGEEATFSLCSFWWVEALARAGRLDEARLAFEKMLTYANHVGLYSEEIGPTGEQLGNFPQAFTHLALISAASIWTASSGPKTGANGLTGRSLGARSPRSRSASSGQYPAGRSLPSTAYSAYISRPCGCRDSHGSLPTSSCAARGSATSRRAPRVSKRSALPAWA